LSASDTRQAWTPLNPSSGDNPEVLLKTSRGLQSPRSAMRQLLLSAPGNTVETDGDGDDTQAMVKRAAYVMFEDGDFEAGQDGQYPEWYLNLEREFSAGLTTVCGHSGLL
jgi:hypothetical protein